MKRFSLCFLCLALILSLCGCVLVVDNTQPRVIGMVSKKDESSFWDSVLTGAEDAAIENGYAITFRGPQVDGPEGLGDQRKIVELALENQVCGMVVAAVSEGLDDLMERADDMDMPVIQMDSGLFPNDLQTLKAEKKSPVVASVYTDNLAAGAMCAEHLYDSLRPEIVSTLVPYVVGVIQHDLSSAGELRAQGFLEKFLELSEGDPETAGKVRLLHNTCVSEADGAYVKALDELRSQGVRAVFLTNQQSVEQIYDHVKEHSERYDYMVFTGFDAGKKQVAWMKSDTGARLLGSVAQDSYAIGYNAVLQCVNGLEARGVTAFVELSGVWYDRENLQEMMDKRIVYE